MRFLLNLWILSVPIILTSCSNPKMIHICYDAESTTVSYGVNRLSNILQSSGYVVENCQKNHSISSGIVILTLDQKKCVGHWKNVIRLTDDRYKPMPYVSMGHLEQRWPEFKAFHWKYFLKDVEADIEFVRNTEMGE